MTTDSVEDTYSELVRRYFANPVHAGKLPEEYNEGIVAEAAESDTGARVVLSAVVDEESIRLLRYQVFGCPHLIAAAEAFCDAVEGKGFRALTDLDVPSLMRSLAIPVEKTGKVFVLEDAANALHIKVTNGPTRHS